MDRRGHFTTLPFGGIRWPDAGRLVLATVRNLVTLVGLLLAAYAGHMLVVAFAQRFNLLGGFEDVDPYSHAWALTFCLVSAGLVGGLTLFLPLHRVAPRYLGVAAGVAAVSAVLTVASPVAPLHWIRFAVLPVIGAALILLLIRRAHSLTTAVAILWGGAVMVTFCAAALGYSSLGGTLNAEQRYARAFQSGPVWDGEWGRSGMSRAEIETFSEVSLFWLGERFDRYNLNTVLHIRDEVDFIYGTCEIQRQPPFSDGGCAVPLSVQVRPICAVRPEQFAWANRPLEVTRGGAQRISSGDAIWLWTGNSSIRIGALSEPHLAEAAVAELRGVGVTAAIRPGDDLPPPDFSGC